MTSRHPLLAVMIAAALACPGYLAAQTSGAAKAKPKAATPVKRDPTRPDGDRLLTPEQLKACVQQRDAMHARLDAVQKEKQELDGEKAELQQLGGTIEAEKASVDATNVEAVDALNRRIEARNARVDAWQARVDAYNGRAEQARGVRTEYEQRCEQRRYDERDLADIKRKTR